MDLEPAAVQDLLAAPFGQIFRPDGVVLGCHGGGNNFARGFFTNGAALLPSVLEAVRREVSRSRKVNVWREEGLSPAIPSKGGGL